MRYILDPELARAHKTRNILHSVLLIGGLGFLMGVCAWILSGPPGLAVAVAVTGGTAIMSPRISPEIVMRLYRARPLRDGGGSLTPIMRELAHRAELPTLPRLYIVPSDALNALAAGTPANASVAITHGLVQRLDIHEIAAVLAHEVSHIRNNDLWIMGLADILGRITQIMSWFGIFLLAFNLPSILDGGLDISLLAAGLLLLAPTIGSLLQLALCRAREYDADLEGAQLLDDPTHLARALEKLRHQEDPSWRELVFPGRGISQLSLLRSHPPTSERIRRLLELGAPERAPRIPVRSSRQAAMDYAPGPRQGRPGVRRR